jgi:hypothetical protein
MMAFDFYIGPFSEFPDKFPHLIKLDMPRGILRGGMNDIKTSLTHMYLPILFNRPGFELVLFGPMEWFGRIPSDKFRWDRSRCFIRKKAGSKVDWIKNIEGFLKILTEISDSRFCLDQNSQLEWQNTPIQRIALSPSGMAEVQLEMHNDVNGTL